LLLALAACGGAGTADPDAAPIVDAGPAQPERGAIEVIEVTTSAGGYNVVSAQFFDGPRPRYHTLTDAAGACTLEVFEAAFCDPACDGGYCNAGTCIPYPTFVPAGAVSIEGTTAPIELSPGDYYYPAGPLPTDLFAPGAAVTASLAGDAAGLPAMTLTAAAPAPIVAAIDDVAITLAPGVDHTVRWTPDDDDPSARVRLTLNANNVGHGYPFEAIIRCDVADAAGEVTIDAALVDAFPATEAWKICAGHDCPPSSLTRYHEDRRAVADGDVVLRVGARLEFGVIHTLP
jgi:hypothetical protein